MTKRLRLPREQDQEILIESQRLIRDYLEAREALKGLGVIRTERNFQGDYAEWVEARMLDLDLSTSSVQKGVDAQDRQGRTYQIKSRQVGDLSSARTSFDMSVPGFPFDYLVGVFFGPAFEILGVIRVSHEVVMELGSQAGSTFRLYWNRRNSQDTRVEHLFWAEGVR